MKESSIVFVIASILAPLCALGQPCPDTTDTTGDQDHDGVSNADDPCCLVASEPGDTSDAMCASPAYMWDLNGNGIPR